MIFKDVDVLIITYDIRLNQTFTNRYISFNQTLNQHHFRSKIISVKFPFTTHPINNLKEKKSVKDIDNVVQLTAKKLNPIQKQLLLIDNKSLSYTNKKIFLALHLMFYKVDHWFVSKKDLSTINLDASVIISGGSSGIIKSASYLADKNKAKLVLDYRDPLNFGYHLLETNKLIYKLKGFFTIRNEIRFLRKADHIITISESLKSFFPQEFQKKISVIENGSNYEFNLVKAKINKKPKEFNIVYLGRIYNEQLLDETFFKAIKAFVKQFKIIDSSLKIYFLGSKLDSKLPEIITKYALETFTHITERLEEKNILNYLLNASMFLHLKYGNRSQIITSKNADYLMFKKPILLPVSDKGDLAESITKYKAGYICNGIEETVNALNKEYNKFLNKENVTLDNGDFSFLSRSEISKKLLTVIKNLQS